VKKSSTINSGRWLSLAANNTVSDSPPGQAGKATYSEIQINKFMDTSSLSLLKNLATGKSIAKGTIYFFNSSDQPYLVIRLKNILVTNFQLGTSSQLDKAQESVSLSFSAINFEYTPYKDGRPLPKQTLDIDVAGNSTK
jgi:type VI protein secretion system component Hcp